MGTLWTQGPSPQHRTGVHPAGKKTPLIDTDHIAAAAAYEQLRRHMLQGSPGGGGFGLSVLLREGVAAWIYRCADCPAPAPSMNPNDAAAAPPLHLPPQFHTSLVQILASIAWTMTQEIHHEH